MSQTPFTAEDLYLYSMQLLEPEENQQLEEFLQRSSEARTELVRVRGDLAYLAFSAEQQTVPPISRHRFMNQVARERRVLPPVAQTVEQPLQQIATPAAITTLDEDNYTPSVEQPRLGKIYDDDDRPRRSFLGLLLPWTGWAVAAGLAFTTWTYYQHTVRMGTKLAAAQDASARAAAMSAQARTVLDTLRSDSSQRFLLTAQGTAPAPSARVTYLAATGSVVFQGNNLDSLPTDKTYELWLIPADKAAQPIPSGTFKPDTRGFASLILPGLPTGITAGTFGITMENEGGSQAPTLPILLVGA